MTALIRLLQEVSDLGTSFWHLVQNVQILEHQQHINILTKAFIFNEVHANLLIFFCFTQNFASMLVKEFSRKTLLEGNIQKLLELEKHLIYPKYLDIKAKAKIV